MAKKKFKKGHKIPYNIFENGGPIGSITSGSSTDISQITQLGQGGASGSVGMQPITPKVGGGFNIGAISGIGSAVTGIAQAGISNAQIADTSGIEAQNKAQKNMVVGASSNDDLMSEWGSWNKVKDNYSWKDVRGGSTGQRITNTLGSIGQGASSGASVGGPIGAAVGGVVGLGSSIAGIFAGNRKAKRKARQLNKQAKEANDRALNSFETRADNIDTQNDFNMLANFSAYGGPLNFGSGAIGYEFANKYLNNQEMSAMAKQRLTSLPNSFQALPEMNTYNAFAFGGNLFDEVVGNTYIPVDNTYVYKPEYIEPQERHFGNRVWSELSPREQLNVSLGRTPEGAVLEKGLNIVSPEFDLLTGLRGITNLPKGFLKGNGKIPIEKTKYYRQVNKLDKGIERAKKIGVIDTKPPTSASKPVKVKGVQLTRKTNFDVPFFSRDNLWYGRDPKYDVIVGDVKDFNWMPITKHGGFRPEMIDDIEAHVRATPLVDGVANKAAASKFEYYRNYPIIGMRNVTEGFPTIPITGLNTTTEAVNKKALGGTLTHGGDFTNGVTFIDEGGSHEENPLTGVPMGIASDGKPNLVEEGEVIFNNYVFSDRLNLSDNMLKNINLSSKYKDKTFAETAEKLSEESKERPYDPISRRGLLANMAKLMQAQEEVKAKKEKNTEGRQFAYGGKPDNWDSTLLDDSPFTWEDYEAAQENINTAPNETQEAQRNSGLGLDSLRYVPALGAGIGVFTDAMGWTNKPDYSNSDMVLNEVSNLSDIEATPIGNYLSYNPFDRDFYINKLNQQTAATRRGLMNTSGGNRLNAQAGILAADYNYGQNLGDLARKAEEYNLAQKEKVESFNRGTNQFNSDAKLRAAGMNQQNREMKLRAIMQAAGMREEVGARSSAAKSANLTNFFDSLGDIGREEFSRNMIESNSALGYTIDRSGKVRYKKPKSGTKSKKKSKGGYLTYGK